MKLAKWPFPMVCLNLVIFVGVSMSGEQPNSKIQGSPQSESSLFISFVPQLPQNLPQRVWEQAVPKVNPLSPAKVQLGKKLFFDKRLSLDDTVSCATCHLPELAFTDGKQVSTGIQGRTGTRNAPTILNAMFSSSQFWDGRAKTLEDQAKLPLINPVEMGMKSHAAVIEKVKQIKEYPPLFNKAFGGEPTIDRLAQAIASFERTQLSGDSPFDRFFFNGQTSAISKSAQRGWELFRGKARCQSCHTFVPQDSPFSAQFQFFTFFQFQNIGIGTKKIENFERVAQDIHRMYESGPLTQEKIDSLVLNQRDISELGRFMVTLEPQDLGAFKTPTLRDVELTAPYMHDGSLRTLMEVVEFYDQGGHSNSYLDHRISPLGLNEQEKRDLVAFMKSLTSERTRNLTKETVLPDFP